ncbi:GntR family transcriptional regulator [Ectobacillus antri]|jgi:GntR family transcriptional regulator|uniref:GntR family transcriptional regulator n=1 Tax=Ectobacillus antri TaxID=2486280 RepID=A0ABT6H3W4_9BACI|nr:GntR family transcriptional regulator [Ectobacillus antri]MDG4658396.1 GntR family transcriptional regulator [Ectobacillus antri]MDG5753730.1 GntR family transcriptional regulator [Ectobacillus antri]
MKFDANIPIYIQIMDYIKKEIVTGRLREGDKVPSVRELASELQINPNTVQRTFQELEREGVLETRRGMGRYVTKEREKIMELKKDMSKDLLTHFIAGMRALGFSEEEIKMLVEISLSKEEKA